MPRRRLPCVSPPCSSSDEDHPNRPCSSSDEGLGPASPDAEVMAGWGAALNLDTKWVYESVEAWTYKARGLHDDNRVRAREVIETFIRVTCRQMLEERVALGWAPASPAAHVAMEEDDAEAFRYTLRGYEQAPWLYVIRAWEYVIGCDCERGVTSPDPYPEEEFTIGGLVWDLLQTRRAQIRNSVYSPVLESDWE